MAQQFNAVDEVRKHPGVTAGVIAVLAGIGIATLLLNQRSGPTRYQRIRDHLDARRWFDAEALRERFDDIARGVRHGAGEIGHRAADLTGTVQDRTGRFGDEARHHVKGLRQGGNSSRKPNRTIRRYKKQARRYAEDAGDFARDHAREGSALLAVATIAAAIGAAALENRRKGGGLLG